MGMDFYSLKGGYFRWNNRCWPKLLRLAENYGWEPAGSLASKSRFQRKGSDWDGYFGDSEMVTKREANALGKALERALSDIPDEDTLTRWRNPSGGWSLEFNTVDDKDWFSGSCKSHLRYFIEFCSAGAFRMIERYQFSDEY